MPQSSAQENAPSPEAQVGAAFEAGSGERRVKPHARHLIIVLIIALILLLIATVTARMIL
jgi:hypothetical protein